MVNTSRHRVSVIALLAQPEGTKVLFQEYISGRNDVVDEMKTEGCLVRDGEATEVR